MKRFKELVNKKFLTLEELEELEIMADYIQFNGLSGAYVGYKWYSIVANGKEYDVYLG